MPRSLPILTTTLLVSCVAEAEQTSEQLNLRATVRDVVMLSRFSGTVTPVDVDPRFALTVRIESVIPTDTKFVVASVVTFAIHSPSKLFAGEDAKGKTYDFLVRRKSEEGKMRYLELEIRKEQANKGAAANRR